MPILNFSTPTDSRTPAFFLIVKYASDLSSANVLQSQPFFNFSSLLEFLVHMQFFTHASAQFSRKMPTFSINSPAHSRRGLNDREMSGSSVHFNGSVGSWIECELIFPSPKFGF
jgi:hypothetical protein